MKTAGDILKSTNSELVIIKPDKTIYEVIKLMIKSRIGAVVIEQDAKLSGIWTERDYLRNTVLDGFDPKTAIISDYMHPNIFFAPVSDNIYQLMDRLLGLKIRHILIKKDDKYLGFLTAEDLIRESLREKDKELTDLKNMISWSYHENWRW